MQESNNDLVFPRDMELRLMQALSEDIDSRLKDVTLLVALQETELAILWLTIFGLTTYIIVKEHNGR